MEPALAELYGRIGDLGEARGVTLRVGSTGESIAVVKGDLPKGWRHGIVRSRTGPARASKSSLATA